MNELQKCKTELKRILKTKENYQTALKTITEKIKLLESIYMTGGLTFSAEFSDSAVKERNKLCVESSALHSLIRETKQEVF